MRAESADIRLGNRRGHALVRRSLKTIRLTRIASNGSLAPIGVGLFHYQRTPHEQSVALA